MTNKEIGVFIIINSLETLMAAFLPLNILKGSRSSIWTTPNLIGAVVAARNISYDINLRFSFSAVTLRMNYQKFVSLDDFSYLGPSQTGI